MYVDIKIIQKRLFVDKFIRLISRFFAINTLKKYKDEYKYE